MKRNDNSIRKILAQYGGRYGDPSREHVASAVETIWEKLRPEAHKSARLPDFSVTVPQSRTLKYLWPAAATVIVLAILVPAILLRNENAPTYKDASPIVKPGGRLSVVRTAA